MLSREDLEILRKLNILRPKSELAVDYENEPTGDPPDIGRQIDNLPPFLHFTMQEQNAFKDIVICDPELVQSIWSNQIDNYFGPKKKESLETQFANFYGLNNLGKLPGKLRQLGKKIYFWDGKDLVEYDPEEDPQGMELIAHVLRLPKTVDKATILRRAQEQFGLVEDDLLLTDSEWREIARSITNPDTSQGFPQNYSIDQRVLSFLSTGGINKKIINLTILNQGPPPETIPDFNHTRTLTLDGYDDLNAIGKVIKHFPNLKSLTINAKNFSGKLTEELKEFEHLETLCITLDSKDEMPNFYTSTFAQLLKACPKLKNLHVRSRGMTFFKESDIELPKLPHLQQMECPGEHPFVQLIQSSVKHLWLGNFSTHFEKLTPEQLSGITHLVLKCQSGGNLSKELKNILTMLPTDLRRLALETYGIEEEKINKLLRRFATLEQQSTYLEPPSPRLNRKQGGTSFGSWPEDDTHPEGKHSATQGSGKKSTHASAFSADHRPSLEDNTELDANTENDLTHSVQQALLFKTKDPSLNDPRLYRLQVFTGLDEKLTPITEYGEWKPYTPNRTHLLEDKFDAAKDPNLAYSSMELTNTPGKQILYSLSPNEKLTDVEIIPKDANVVFHYDSKTRLYAAEVIKANGPVQLNYMLQVNRKKYSGNEKIDDRYKKMVRDYSDPVFQPGKLEIKDQLKGRALLEVIRKQHKGTCKHRSFGCFDEALTQTDIANHRMQMSGSSSHAFVEIITPEGDGITVDLGGAAVGKRETLPFNPKGKTRSAVTVTSTAPRKQYDPDEYAQYEAAQTELSDKSVPEFFADLLAQEMKPILLQTTNESQMKNLETAAAKHMRSAQKPYLYIDDLDQLKSASTKAFLKSLTDATDAILIVRWDKSKTIKPEHVGLNSLFDIPPKLEGESLPVKLRIVALAEQQSVIGDDVRSRFQGRIVPVPENLVFQSAGESVKNAERKAEDKAVEAVPLYSSFEWEKMLVGHSTWLNGQKGFVPGKLMECLTAGQNALHLVNPPWHVPEFVVFWNKLINERRFFANGVFHDFPDSFSLTWSQVPYIRPDHVTVEALDDKNSQNLNCFLNQKTFKQFFQKMTEKEGKTIPQPGYFAEHKDKDRKLSILVTEKLTDGQFEQLFVEAKKHHCQLTIIAAPDIELPARLRPEKKPQTMEFQPRDNLRIQTCNDLDFFAKQHPDHVVLNVAPDTGYGLVENWIAKKSDGGETNYINEEGILLKLLKEGKNVMLTGKLSDKLVKRLQTLFADPPYLEFNGNRYEFGKGEGKLQGKLQIVTKENVFAFAEIPHKQIKPEMYLEFVNEDDLKYRELITKLCDGLDIKLEYYSQIQSILKNLKTHPERNPVEWLLLMQKHPEQLLQKGLDLYRKLNPQPAPAHEEKYVDELDSRMREMHSRLDTTPFLFLIGPSGTGKSTTVLQELKKFYQEQSKDIRIFVTTPPAIENVAAWAKCTDGGDKTMKFLFIDEANLAAEESFAFAQGMLKKPPEIVYRGEKIILSENHKIIFAGNYQHYENRKLHELFLKQDCVQHFSAFSPEFIHRKQVLPLIDAAIHEEKSATDSASIVLNIFLAAMAESKSIMPKANLTTRNLQSMALAFDVLWNKPGFLPDMDKLAKLKLIAQWVFYQNARDALGDNNSEYLKSYLFGSKEAYDGHKKSFDRVKREEIVNIHVASIHKRAVAVLQEEMHIRDLRNRTEKSFGLASGTCGTLIGGVPGIGKSSVAINVLKKLGFTEADEKDAEEKDSTKKFYHITLTNPQKMKKTLLKAFHEGAVVVIDEINTIPVEALLNSLMMGVDDKGKAADKKGFYVIGTYNPLGKGRHNLSPAAENRFRKIDMPDYTEHDLDKFLKVKFMHVAKDVREYFNDKYQRAKNQEPPYTFRDLLKDMEHAEKGFKANTFFPGKRVAAKKTKAVAGKQGIVRDEKTGESTVTQPPRFTSSGGVDEVD